MRKNICWKKYVLIILKLIFLIISMCDVIKIAKEFLFYSFVRIKLLWSSLKFCWMLKEKKLIDSVFNSFLF